MSSDSQNFEERRDFIRMFVDAKVTILDPSTHKKYDGEAKNLSGNGIMFITKELFQIGQQLQVDISSTQSQLPPLSMSFEVKRIKPIENGLFEVAGKMSQLT
jgi:hypothetical protein